MVKSHLTFKFFIFAFLVITIVPISVLASNKEFEYTNEEKKDNKKIVTDLPVSVFIHKELNAWNDNSNIFFQIKNPFENSISNKRKFSLNEYFDLEVKNQENTQACWAFSIFTSMETNLFLKKNIKEDFSERHLDYATSSSFSDLEYNKKYNRTVTTGAITETGLSYLTNGQGAVLEKEMKFKNDLNNISFSETNIKPTYYVTDYSYLPNIFKKYDKSGNATYYDGFGNPYSNLEVKEIRKKIKEYITKNGAIVSVTASKYEDGYNNLEDASKSTNYCCKDINQVRDHAITIVGWDDDYDKNNFNEKNRPKNNGAYLVLQSYGTHFFDKGYMYISYEDSLIETSLYGICNSEKYDYDNLYQNDFYGANGTLHLKNCRVGYLSTYFSRDEREKENLTKVSVNIPESSNIEVWVNPNGSELDESKLIKVTNSPISVEPGYHSFDITPTKLTSNCFAIVIKQINNLNDFYFNVEYNQNKNFYENVKSDKENCKVSKDGKNWEVLNNQPNEELKEADLCIKAFTKKVQ